jgi:magnesium-transporting ATPase (P-type)
VPNVNFNDPKAFEHLNGPDTDAKDNLLKVLLHLSLCHTIITDQRTGKFNASSPDELALIYASKFFGAEFVTKDENNFLIVKFFD